jgi:cation transport ATPase
MWETVIEMPKMDCPSEERLVRMALQPEQGVRHLTFDLEAHRVTVRHEGDPDAVLARLSPLGFGARIIDSDASSGLMESVVEMPKMDCPSEERLVRMALEGHVGVRDLAFDLDAHRVVVRHEGHVDAVLERLAPLGFGARLVESSAASAPTAGASTEVDESAVLKQLLAINGAMFVFEIVLGWIARSAGLLADSVDMFADAAVYGIALYAVGRTAERQKRAALTSACCSSSWPWGGSRRGRPSRGHGQ